MTSCAAMSGDDDAPERARRSSWLDPDLDVLAKSRQEIQEALNRESVEVVVLERGHLWLVDSQQLGGVALCEASGNEHAIDFDAQSQLRIELGRIGEFEIGEHITRAGLDWGSLTGP